MDDWRLCLYYLYGSSIYLGYGGCDSNIHGKRAFQPTQKIQWRETTARVQAAELVSYGSFWFYWGCLDGSHHLPPHVWRSHSLWRGNRPPQCGEFCLCRNRGCLSWLVNQTTDKSCMAATHVAWRGRAANQTAPKFNRNLSVSQLTCFSTVSFPCCLCTIVISYCRHFFFTAMLYTYGRFLSRQLVNTVTSDHLLYKVVSGLIKYQMFICYFLYIAGRLSIPWNMQ